MIKRIKCSRPWVQILCVAMLTACLESGGPSIETDRRSLVLRSLATNVIVPMYANFWAQSQALAAAIETFCADPLLENLLAAQLSWTTARDSWKQADVIKFGPYIEEPLRLGPKIDFWPARTDTIEAFLTGDTSIDVPGALQASPATLRGLPVMEYLLFSPKEPNEQLTLFTSAPNAVRRCAYLRALGSDLQANAHAIHEAWRPEGGNYAGTLITAGPTNNQYPTVASAISDILNRLGFLVEDIRTDKLGRPLGQSAGGIAQPELLESRFSGRSLDDIRANLQGVRAMATGRYMNTAGLGLLNLVPPLSNLSARFDTELETSLQSIRLVPEPLGLAVISQPATVEAAIESLKTLQILLQLDVAPAIGATVTFNDNDGD